jgi:hypothetical protein
VEQKTSHAGAQDTVKSDNLKPMENPSGSSHDSAKREENSASTPPCRRGSRDPTDTHCRQRSPSPEPPSVVLAFVPSRSKQVLPQRRPERVLAAFQASWSEDVTIFSGLILRPAQQSSEALVATVHGVRSVFEQANACSLTDRLFFFHLELEVCTVTSCSNSPRPPFGSWPKNAKKNKTSPRLP